VALLISGLESLLKRILTLSGLNCDSAQFGEFVYARLAPEPAIARCLGAPKRPLRFIVNCGSIDMADTGFHLPREIHSTPNITIEYSGAYAAFEDQVGRPVQQVAATVRTCC